MSTVSETSVPLDFWQRQICPAITGKQIGFDVMIGIVPSIICCAIFFRGITESLLGQSTIGATILSGIAFVSLSSWLMNRSAPALTAGMLSACTLFALWVGLLLFPLSIHTLWLGIGVIGFFPFAIAFVYLRNAIRAFRKAMNNRSNTRLVLLAVIGFLVTGVGPWAAQAYVERILSRAIESIVSPDPAEVARGMIILERLRWFADFDRLVTAYALEKDEVQRRRLADSYKQLTGMDVERRREILNSDDGD